MQSNPNVSRAVPAEAEPDEQPAAAEDGPSRSGLEPASGPSLFERFAGYFRPRPEATLRENLAEALAVTDPEQQTFSPGERAMLNNILRLREVTISDVMVPRADIEALEVSTSLAELLTVFEQSGHSRMPVYAGSLDDPRGMVHIRDVVAHLTRAARSGSSSGTALDLAGVELSKTVEELKLIRPILFVPPFMLASELMARMQASRTQMALVIDEYGGTDGLVSLEDLVEIVVGDIEDEHDEDDGLITTTGDGIYLVDGKAEIEDVVEAIGPAFQPRDYEDYVDTIGGLIVNALGRVPTRGEVVEPVEGFEFHVLEADPRRVKRVRIIRKPSPVLQQ